jgi:hypothetical protein
MDAENRTVFVSSCSRRELARRRPNRSALRMQMLVAAIFLAAAVGVFLVAWGGL